MIDSSGGPSGAQGDSLTHCFCIGILKRSGCVEVQVGSYHLCIFLDIGFLYKGSYHNLWAVICAGAISWLYIPALIAGVYFDIPVSVLRLQAAKIVMMNVFSHWCATRRLYYSWR